MLKGTVGHVMDMLEKRGLSKERKIWFCFCGIIIIKLYYT